MNKYYIPQNLDASFRIGIFSSIDLIVMVVPFCLITFAFHKPILAIMISAGLFYVLRKLQGDEDSHFYKHFFYWHFPSVGLYQATPPSHVREIIG